ncbi:MAG: CPBP family intramembrane metalloprotease [Verrucomicrobiae bacterium]|nr:CPBP family intramembrane metalloprotease [Verrucomicrobiae bacterium]
METPTLPPDLPNRSGVECAPPSADRKPAWWAWPLILLVPVGLLVAERWLPAAEAEAGAQHDLSLLAILQFQAKIVIAMDGLPGGEARRQANVLESHVRSDGTAAALAMLHGFLGLDDGGREAATLLLAKRREARGADAAFLELAGRAILEGVDDRRREELRSHVGWFADLLGEPGAPEKAPLAGEIRSDASVLVFLLGLVAFLVFAALFAGAGLLLFAVIRSKQGRLALAFDASQRPAGVFLESFALFLASMAAGNLAGWLVHWLAQPIISLSGVALAVIWPRLRGNGWRESRLALGWHTGKGWWREIGAGMVGYLIVLPLALMGVAFTAMLIGVAEVLERLSRGAEAAANGAGAVAGAASEPVTHPAVGWMLGGWDAKIAVLLLAAVLAPLVEETFFRGAFFRSLRRRWRFLGAGLLNGVIFASLHPQGWLAIPALTAMGLAFACLREWRDSLIAPMVAHAINNGLLIGGLALVLS